MKNNGKIFHLHSLLTFFYRKLAFFENYVYLCRYRN